MEGRTVVKVLKALGWTLAGIAVLLAVLLFCAVRFIDSKYLSPIVERIADDMIDGRLELGDIRLRFNPGFPILAVEVKDLAIVSAAFDSLAPEERGLLPGYADSLLTLDYMRGAIDIKRLIKDNEISLHDVALRGLSVNLVIARDGKANYEVIKLPSDSTRISKGSMPGFRINRFAIEDPKEIRFYNAADSVAASVLLLTDAAVDGERQPTYRLRLNGNVTSPQATLVTNLDRISFGLNGKVYWNPAEPGLVAMDEMEIRGAFLRAIVAGKIDLADSPVVREATVDLRPVAVTDLLTLLPDSIKDAYRLHAPYFRTDMAVGVRFKLTAPMNLATDTLPAAAIDISVAPSTLQYGHAGLRDISLEARINTVTNLPDRTTVEITRLNVEGPGTKLEARASVVTPVSDPAFDAAIKGKIDLRDLPPLVTAHIPGYLAGIIDAEMTARGSASMFRPERLHHLVADGFVKANCVYFLSADTSKMVEIGAAKLKLDSKRIFDGMPLLHTEIEVDTATILVSGVDLALGNIRLGAGVEKPGSNPAAAMPDTMRMMPVAGRLKVGRFNITSITDGAGARISDIAGRVGMSQPKAGGGAPELSTTLRIGSVSAGTLSDRVIINDTDVKAFLHKMSGVREHRNPVKKKMDIHKQYSYISPAAVHRYVYDKRRHRKRIRRVYGDVGADDDEMLVWNLTPQFRRFLNEWKLRGSVDTREGRLLTPLFPLRTRLSRVSLEFSNDTVDISDISLRAGNSDVTMSGLVSNVRRALTAKTDNNLKGNFSLLSDTIDINELSASVFTGASYADARKHGKAGIEAGDERTLQSRLDELSKAGPGKRAPVLIPVNIDANLRIEADHLLYSDLDMRGMKADVLVYDGGVNLHDMRASSDAGSLNVSALYSAPRTKDMLLGFGMELEDFNIGKFVNLVPAIDSITPLMHDFSGMIGANIAATCRIDSGMNIDLSSLDAAIRISGDNLAFIDPKKYRTLGKWLGFKDKADNTIHSLNVEMTVADGLMHVYPFAFNIDRYRLGVYGHNDITMNFDYHLAVLKSPLPFRFGVTVSGNPKKYKVRFGGARFDENTVIDSRDVVRDARINLMDQIEGVFKRGVRNSRFAKLKVAKPAGWDALPDSGLSAADSLQLIREGILEAPSALDCPADYPAEKDGNAKTRKKKHKRFRLF